MLYPLKALPQKNFNSQPHKEADNQKCVQIAVKIISTHSLTRRLTWSWQKMCDVLDISTHSLTRRLTAEY